MPKILPFSQDQIFYLSKFLIFTLYFQDYLYTIYYLFGAKSKCFRIIPWPSIRPDTNQFELGINYLFLQTVLWLFERREMILCKLKMSLPDTRILFCLIHLESLILFISKNIYCGYLCT